MANQKQLEKIKNELEKNIGTKIRLVSKRGKRQLVIKDGVIVKTYPGIFIVKLYENDNRESIASYSYSDVLTKTVELSLIKA